MNNVKLKKLLNISIRICIVFLLCFCIACSKQGLNNKIFTDIVEKNDFVVTDISVSGDKSELTLLAVGNHYQIYYYEFTNKNAAEKQYKLLKKSYTNNKGNLNDTEKSKNGYKYYKVFNDNIYSVVYISNNSCVFISSTVNYRNEIDDLLKKLGLN